MGDCPVREVLSRIIDEMHVSNFSSKVEQEMLEILDFFFLILSDFWQWWAWFPLENPKDFQYVDSLGRHFTIKHNKLSIHKP